MHQVVLFIESDELDCVKNNEIGNLFMNRFAIEEDANFEILKIFQVDEFFYDEDSNDLQIDYEKGKGLMNLKL